MKHDAELGRQSHGSRQQIEAIQFDSEAFFLPIGHPRYIARSEISATDFLRLVAEDWSAGWRTLTE